ncbi:creatinine amidohydrolase [Evansella vedderi]|uniref:Creatinine amidohydrolase n=1 Tax=Evansella vedderi TaxID=38282 RepID=A0ABT9ZZN3_9BACI|nr:creatinine amidohydrolase [Evansella vedderi]
MEDYLERNDLIYIPVGTIETHGALPLDCETVLAEAFALKMAEATDGLVLHNLPYFYAGATPVGRGTIQMSIADGMAYLDKLAQSLLNQGFRRQVYVSLHGPAYLTVSSMVRDFFDKTKAPVLYMDMITAISNVQKNPPKNPFDKINEMLVGCYSVMGRLEDVPLNVPESESVSYDLEECMKKMGGHPSSKLSHLAYQSGSVGFYFDKPADHAYTPLIRTEEEREVLAEKGVEAINEVVQSLDMPKILEALREVDEFTQTNSLPKYGEWLPKTK